MLHIYEQHATAHYLHVKGYQVPFTRAVSHPPTVYTRVRLVGHHAYVRAWVVRTSFTNDIYLSVGFSLLYVCIYVDDRQKIECNFTFTSVDNLHDDLNLPAELCMTVPRWRGRSYSTEPSRNKHTVLTISSLFGLVSRVLCVCIMYVLCSLRLAYIMHGYFLAGDLVCFMIRPRPVT